MKPLVLYHANCADGFGAAFAAWKKLGDEAEYVPVQYGRVILPDYVEREVYILDFSFPREVMEDIFREAKRVVWLDHHKTAFEMWCGPGITQHYDPNGQHHIHLNNDKSGAMLAWEYFHPDTEVPMLIKHIDDRDRWVWKLRCTREISACLASFPYDFELWDELMGDGHYGTLCTEGAAILRATQQRIDKAVNGELRKITLEAPHPAATGYLHAYEGLALNAVNDISEIGNAVAKKSGTFSLSFFIKGNEVICSLRSIAPYDVSVIAKYYGGGGHAQAAGFKMPIERFFRGVWK
jgi:oligoribonuclease NrnB/cAMP/cGMP phosphodiesterase (DHH superfamily)